MHRRRTLRPWFHGAILLAVAGAAIALPAHLATADPPARLLTFARWPACEASVRTALGNDAARAMDAQIREAAADNRGQPVPEVFGQFGRELVSIGDGIPLSMFDLFKSALEQGRADTVRGLLAEWTSRRCFVGYNVARNYVGPLDAAFALGIRPPGEYEIETRYTPIRDPKAKVDPDAFKGIVFLRALGVASPPTAHQPGEPSPGRGGRGRGSQDIYRAPDSLLLTLKPESETARDGKILMTGEVKALVGTPFRIDITLSASADIQLSMTSLKVPSLAAGQAKRFDLVLTPGTGTSHERFSSVEMRVEYSPDYNALVQAVTGNPQAYPDPALRQQLVEWLMNARWNEPRHEMSVGYPFPRGVRFVR
jgi:hypothetical protein